MILVCVSCESFIYTFDVEDEWTFRCSACERGPFCTDCFDVHALEDHAGLIPTPLDE